MHKYKAKITRADYERFVAAFDSKETVKGFRSKMHDKFYGKWNSGPLSNSKVDSLYEKMFNLEWIHSDRKEIMDKSIKETLELLIDYLENNDLLWEVMYTFENYMIINFSGNQFFWISDYCKLVEMQDYNDMTLGEMKAIGVSDTMNLPVELNAVSVNRINDKQTDLKAKLQQLAKEKEDANWNRTKELAEMRKKIDEMENQLRKKKDELQAEINAQMSALNAEMEKLGKQLYMLESQIYVIRSYTGETLELKQIRDGKRCSPDTPLIINQKIMYLDEDLARIASIYQDNIVEKFSLFEDAVKYVDDLFESFCPQDRSLTFFRLSKNASYNYYNANRNMYQSEELIHGKKMGFILRDGECAFIGWLDEVWGYDNEEPRKVTFVENLMYKPGESYTTDVEDENETSSDSTNTMLSRFFSMSVVQGIIDNGDIMQFPEKVNVMAPGRYIQFNFATAWLMDDRFGDFASLVHNLNKRTKVKDVVLITYNKQFCTGRGEHDRAHDCEVPEGLNKVNFLEYDEFGHGNIYVSAKKKYSFSGATANILLATREFINITYMNSVWMKYYIQTKKMGTYVEDYAKMIKHLKKAIEVISAREENEMLLIKRFYPDADQIPDWQVHLSHWKIKNKIRFINEFQAKRIAKYFKEGKFYEIEHLYDREENYGNLYHLGDYAHSFQDKYSSWTAAKREVWPEFHPQSKYGKEHFYISTYWRDNEKDIAEKLPEMIKRVPERIPQDIKKLESIRQYLLDVMDKKKILDDMKTGEELIFVDRKDKFRFLRLEELDMSQKNYFLNHILSGYAEYIRTSDLWQIAYYDHLHQIYEKVLSEMKLKMHEHFMQDTTNN